jgi:tryptophan synthase alpha chain
MSGRLETRLRERRAGGHPLLVPYVTAGVGPDWIEHARACAEAGADAIEIGLPFSDPMLDGTAVQQASQRALDRGTTPLGALEELAGWGADVPLVAMTYANVVLRSGVPAFLDRLRAGGVSGLIVVDTPHQEAGPLAEAARAHDVELVMMVAPSTPQHRLGRIARAARGFVYAATVMSPTGERVGVPDSAARIAARVREHTTTPVLLGFGIASPADAVTAARAADGVVVGSALMSRVLAGATPGELGRVVGGLRAALDQDAHGAREQAG